MYEQPYPHNLVDVLTRDHVDRYPRKDLKVLSFHNIVCPLHGHTFVIKYRRACSLLLFVFSRQPRPL